MDKNGMWLPLIASVGVGAATFYTMTKNDQGLGQAVQSMLPFMSNMGGNSHKSNNNKSGNLGTYGMS
ncbi:hypothetical protein CWR48_12085 [Oceanobacillus arenosus]|uniref:Uncharacterized protein n=1 Tax=Oceanobacillus arenosus TaxID=1229153 RepID=A0A3D8PQD6_9BACI|nr:hypothetical protein [Oceanobacillus arenosus]RDW18313.1 hypothetical protein CWR48_12085 [Oceanobacillus arenosus]